MPTIMQLIKKLLKEHESNTLDFKTTQYAFAGATDDQKSEIIKDIISFANTPRTTDAHILLGVKEQKGRAAAITGVTIHPDDAHLQQLINTKTNRPIQFSYQALTIDGKQIGIIRIPPQDRPTYLKHDYGKLRVNTVYLRHGSSTAVATPDEIIQMRTPDVPTLDAQFADADEHTLQGNTLRITSATLHTPADIPDAGGVLDWLVNPSYYREVIAHATFSALMTPVSLAITNTSTVVAHDVRLAITIPDHDKKLIIALDSPPAPDIFDAHKPKPKTTPRKGITVTRTTGAWHLTMSWPKVQPRQTQYARDPVYLGARRNATLRPSITIYADNLPEPIMTTLTIRITARERTITLNQALKRYKE